MRLQGLDGGRIGGTEGIVSGVVSHVFHLRPNWEDLSGLLRVDLGSFSYSHFRDKKDAVIHLLSLELKIKMK